ncbi:uncharacterized protein C8Q71DRAFT_758696 [Rhodofomes roseus]|uniref:Secreted protein n=1 Tax=Rhodofomes roseus TaxID=34475 RepID=A0ABQ8KFN2_9APHY|nr:uncharacterized protein C8Q71DRAFT_758696 [Rhodofomes roseus]KAH9836595.1 hypothetical protein C8Q71DRAFT_758696 [Rhodofomes roseus]
MLACATCCSAVRLWAVSIKFLITTAGRLLRTYSEQIRNISRERMLDASYRLLDNARRTPMTRCSRLWQPLLARPPFMRSPPFSKSHRDCVD